MRGGNSANDKAGRRQARKRAWEEARNVAQETLTEWLKKHPGEDMDPDILGDCAAEVARRVKVVLDEQGAAKADDKPLSEQAAGFVREVYRNLRTTVSFRKSRTGAEWLEIFPRYPRSEDDGRFCRCYDPADGHGMRAAMEKYGVFVVRVMTEEQCDETIEAMFEEVNELREAAGICGPAIAPGDASTWADENWPAKSKFLLSQPALHPIAFRNRCLESVQSVFSALFGDEDRLHATVDNWGIGRGGAVHPKWAKGGLKPHWDINPWCYLRHVRADEDPGYQGLVALTDQTEETGCHLTLPGGTKFLEQWVLENPTERSANRKSKHADLDDPVVRWMQTVPLRRGEMVVWSWGQLHGSTNSRSTGMRLHQYIRMYPAPEAKLEYDYSTHDRYGCARILRRCLRDGLVTQDQLDRALPDERSRRLLGLLPHSSDG